MTCMEHLDVLRGEPELSSEIARMMAGGSVTDLVSHTFP